MYAEGTNGRTRQRVRRELLTQYVKMQREILDADPASAAYQAQIRAFRQLGFLLISSGFENDLDRLLRFRVIDGGRRAPTPVHERAIPVDVHLIDRVMP